MSTFVGQRGQRFLTRSRRLKWLLRSYAQGRPGLHVGDSDRLVLRLAGRHAPTVLGVVALRMEWRGHQVTVLTAPGTFFRQGSMARRELSTLARIARGYRRTILVLEPATLEKRWAESESNEAQLLRR